MDFAFSYYKIVITSLLNSDHKFKIIIVGDAGVGKSCLMQRYAVSAHHKQHKNIIYT